MIHIDFKDLNEMVSFAEQLLGKTAVAGAAVQEGKPAHTTPVAAASVQPAAPTAPVQSRVIPSAPVQPQAIPSAPVQHPVPTAVPTTSVSYTPDDLAKAAMSLMDSGRQADLLGLLQQFGVTSLPELKPEQYGPFATALRGLGAQI